MQRVENFESSLKMFASMGPSLQLLELEAATLQKKIREQELLLEQTGRTKRNEVDDLKRIGDEIKLFEVKCANWLKMRDNMLSMGYNIVRDTYNDSARPEHQVGAVAPPGGVGG